MARDPIEFAVDATVDEGDAPHCSAAKKDSKYHRPTRRVEGLANELGRRIAFLRQAAGLTQRQLAERLGTDASVVCHMELGRKTPSIHRIQAVADALAVDLHRLFRFRPRDDREWATERVVALLARRPLGEVQMIADILSRIFAVPTAKRG
jgi:transcriptional regulator with XRE-family HTH domain